MLETSTYLQKIKNMNIQAIKFTSGEEIISEIGEASSPDKVMLLNPVTLRQVSAQEANFVPWFQIAGAQIDPGAPQDQQEKNRKFEIPSSSVSIMTPAVKEVAETYRGLFSSIITSPQSIITG